MCGCGMQQGDYGAVWLSFDKMFKSHRQQHHSLEQAGELHSSQLCCRQVNPL